MYQLASANKVKGDDPAKKVAVATLVQILKGRDFYYRQSDQSVDIAISEYTVGKNKMFICVALINGAATSRVPQALLVRL